MDMTISIPEDVAARLQEQAARSGQTMPAYTARLLAETVKRPTVDDVLAPFRKQVAESGMSDQELDSFLEDVREKAYQDRQRHLHE
jgi:hypothetical protein